MSVPQDQEFLKENGQTGDCVRASVATLLGLDRAEVPHFVAQDGGYWKDSFQDWLLERGMAFIEIDPRTRPRGRYLACGPTERSGPGEHPAAHMVVMQGLGVFHDPHPSRAGLTTIDRVYVVYPTRCEHA